MTMCLFLISDLLLASFAREREEMKEQQVLPEYLDRMEVLVNR